MASTPTGQHTGHTLTLEYRGQGCLTRFESGPNECWSMAI